MYQLCSKIGILLLVAILAACGGGGGGGGSSSVTATTVLADEDSLQVTQEVFATPTFAQSFALGFGLGLDSDAFVSASVAAVAEDPDAGDTLASYTASLVRSMTTSGEGDTPVFAPSVVQSCDQGGFVDIDETGTSNSARLELTFTDCEGYGDRGVDFSGIINGRMAVSVFNPSPFGADFSIAIDSMSVVDGEDSLFMDGNFDGTVTFDSNVSYIEVELSTDSFYSIENGVESELISYTFTTRITDASIREGFTGGLDGYGFEGIVSFYTPIRLRFTNSVGTYTDGELIIEAADGARIRIAANSSDYPIVEIDEDGDGVVELEPTWSWYDDILLLLEF